MTVGDYYYHFASKDDLPLYEDIKKQDELLNFEELTNKDIYDFTSIMIKDAMQPIGIKVTIDNELIFQYLMDDINSSWLDRKEAVCKESKQSSYATFLQNIKDHSFDYMIDDEKYGLVAGSIPILIKDNFVGTISVTGLKPYQDHQTIIDGIIKYRKKRGL